MSGIKLNLRQAIPGKLQTGRQIIAAMTNSPNFANPHPSIGGREINLNWRKVDNSRSYIIQLSPDPPTPTVGVTRKQ